MTFFYSPSYIWKITSKPECNIETKPLLRKWILHSPNDISKITLKPEWYLENNHPTDREISIHLKVF